MRVSLAALAAPRQREDRRPLYRRIFTNRRLDILHKSVIRTVIGFALFSTSYAAVNALIYYEYVRPYRKEEREQLERELIEADRAGFHIKLREVVGFVFGRLGATYPGCFSLGVATGFGFELFKIHFSFNGVNYYSVFKKNQVRNELNKYEMSLAELHQLVEKEFARRIDAATNPEPLPADDFSTGDHAS